MVTSSKSKQDRMSFCETCVREGRGRGMSESESRIHRDNFPDHQVISPDQDIFAGEEID